MRVAHRFLKRSVVAGVFASLAALPARADWSLINMPQGVSELSRGTYELHMLMFWICFVIAVFTFGAMIVAMTRFRKSKGAVADQSEFRREYNPSHPAADADGYVRLPNVDPLVEMMDIRDAARAYEANLNMVEAARAMTTRALDLLRR